MKQTLFFLSTLFTVALGAQSAISFGGTNAYVTFGNNTNLRQAQFTIECWFMRTGAGTTTSTGTGGITNVVPLVTKGRGENDGSNVDMNWLLGVRASDTVLVADFEEITPGPSPGLNHPVIGITPLVRNVWYHGAATYDGATWRLYLNGALEATLVVNRTPQNGSIQHAAIGSALTSTGAAQGFFRGVIDEVRVWSYARTQLQVQGSINQQITTPTAGLVARWGLNEGAGTSVSDNSGNFITGTITGSNYTWVAGAPFNINIPPSVPVAVTPAANQTCVSNVAHLSATSTDATGGTVTVNFYGRPLNTDPDFTIIPIPDTQYYTGEMNGGNNGHLKAQMNWIVANRLNLNIQYCAELGDCVEHGDNGGNDVEWRRADTSFKIIENPATTTLPEGIPYGIAVGNHDQSAAGDPNGTTTFYNQYFGAARFAGRAYYGGCYGSVNCDNHFELFSAGGMDFISISLEYDQTANAAVLNWADSLLAANPARKGIVYSHWLINGDGTWGAQGLATYNALKDQPNLFLMLCGHIANGEATRSDTYNGHTVHTVLSDYQSRTNGGDGWMRIMTFRPSQNNIAVKTYSPTLGQYETDANSQFTLPYDMGLPYQLIGTMVINSGDTAFVNWSGLAYSTSYQWYSTVSDGTTTVTGSTQTFTTGTGNTVSLGADVSNCTSVTLAPQSPCGTCTYAWSTGATTASINATGSGSYIIGETDALGCIARDTVNVTIHGLPSVSFTAPVSSLCADAASVTLTGGSPAGGTYSGSGVSAGQFNPLFAGVGSHNVTYQFTDGNGCSASAMQSITVHNANTVNLGSDAAQCTGNVTLAPVAPCATCTYAWSTGATTSSITAASTGTYSVLETDVNGCSARDTVNVTIHGLPSVVYSPPASVFCPEASAVTLSGATPAGGVFSGPGVTAGMFTAQTAGTGTHSILYSYTDGNGCSNSSSASFTVHPANSVILGNDVSQCTGSVLLNAVPSCGSCTYAWSTGATTSSVVAGSSGSYSVIETDANGCTARDTVNITIFGLPSVTFTPPVSAFCPESGSVALSGASPAGGTFSGTAVSAGMFSPVVAGSGTHNILYSYTDGNGCSNSATAPLTVHTANTVALGSDIAQCTGPVSIVPSPSCASCTYLWSTGATTSSVSAGASGSYSVIESDANGCVARDTISITIHGLPSVMYSPSVSSVCLDASAVVLSGASPSGGSYSGNGVSAGQFFPATAGTGTHAIQYAYTDANGCSNTATANITVHNSNTVNLGNNVSQCGGTVAVNSSPACATCTYAWSTGATSANISVSTSGNYSVAETDANGCIARDTVNIAIHTVPVVSYTPSVPAVCEGTGLLSLSGGTPAGGTYSGFAVNSGQFNAMTAGVGTHSIIYSYTDANNCGGTDVAFVTVNALPTVSLSSSADSVCLNSSPMNLTGTPSGGIYSGPGTSGAQFDASAAGVGTHVVGYAYTDANGCAGNASLPLTVNALPVVTLVTPQDTFCLNSSAVILAGNPVGGSFTGPGVSGAQFDPMLAGGGNQQLVYTYTDSSNCTSSDAVSVYVDICLGTEQQVMPSIVVYPNPATSVLNVRNDLNKDLRIELFSMSGQLVYSAEANTSLTIDVSTLSNGVYDLMIYSGGEIRTERVSINR